DAEGGEVMLRQPDGVEAGSVHDLDALEGAGIDLFQRPVTARPAEELQNAELHGSSCGEPNTSRQRVVHCATEAIDDLVDLAGGDDEGRRQQDVIAARAVDRAAHR